MMRVFELGLHALAKRLSIPEPDLQQWNTLIDRIQKAIKDQQGEGRGLTLQFYSEAATNFQYLKDAWRNHAVHPRQTYDELQAETIWHHVSAFMRVLTANELTDNEEPYS
jgi:hypothetical protein